VTRFPRLFGVLLCAVLSLWPWGVGQAQTTPPPATLSPTAEASYSFGQQMVFTLQLTNEPDLQSAMLFVSAPLFANTYTAELPITASPGDTLALRHELDLTAVRLAPFSTLTYWWVVQTTTGRSYELPSATLEYADDQFVWKEIERAGVQIFWVADGLDLGQVALDIALESLPRIQSVVQADLPNPLRIYLYPSAADLRSALRLTGQEWVGGHASPELGVILLPAENPRTAVVDLRRRIPHELSHLLVYRATGTGYANMPRWLDEGLATLFESVPNPNYQPALQEALASDQIIPLEEMCTSFPDSSTNQVYRAYAQSGSLVAFIQASYGNVALQNMLAALADGATCETVVSRGLEITPQKLMDDWLRDVQPSTSYNLISQNLIWLIVLFGGFALTLLLLFSGR
jgi:hypothetical protein